MITDDWTLRDIFSGYKIGDECYVGFAVGNNNNVFSMTPSKGVIQSRSYFEGINEPETQVKFEVKFLDGDIITFNLGTLHKTEEECLIACNEVYEAIFNLLNACSMEV